jgi:hypothetical protein
MSTDAFGARRVRESLRSIGRYLDSASRLAEGIPPGETVRLDLEPPGPRLQKLTAKDDAQHTGKIELPDPATVKNLVMVGKGVNLQKPKKLTLMRVSRHATLITTTKFSNSDDKTFEATFEVKELSPGVYDAKFENDIGQTVLSRAIHLKSRHGDYRDEGRRDAKVEDVPNKRLGA